MLEEEPQTETKKPFQRLENGQVINLNDIASVETKTFNAPDGTMFFRKIYKLKDNTELSVPLVVHGLIKNFAQDSDWKGKLQRVKIKIDGQGKQTRYTVMPLA